MNGICLSDPVNRQEVDTGGEGKKEKGGVLSSALPGNTREKQGCLCKFVNGHIPPARPRPACADMDPTIPPPPPSSVFMSGASAVRVHYRKSQGHTLSRK